MKLTYSGTLTPVVLASLLFSLTAAQAATTTYDDGDIFLGFRATGGTGSTLDYLVNLGSAQQLLTATGPITFSLGNIGADLSSAGLFGANWYTRTDLFYSLIGGTSLGSGQDVENTIYTSDQDASPFARRADGPQSSTSGRIATLGSFYSGNESTTNSSSGLIQNVSDTNSYASYQPGGTTGNSQGISFAAFNPSNELNPSQTAYVDRLTPTSGAAGRVVLGTVALGSDGTVTFSPVPEPSAAAAFSMGLLALGLGRFRRRLLPIPAL